jgi:hypothetical protein
MIETKTLNRFAREFVAFANGVPFVTTEGTPEEMAALRERVRKCCEFLAGWKPESRDVEREDKLQVMAEKWLDDWSGRRTRPAYPFVSMDAAWSLSEKGQLELTVARFGSLTAQCAVTFAALVEDRSFLPKKQRNKWRPMVKRCCLIENKRRCEKYFVVEAPKPRSAPRIYCDAHHEELKRKDYK